MEECHESSEGASVNANRILRNWGCNMARRPQAGGAVLPPISKNEVGIYRCARARLMAFTLLLHKLKPQERKSSDWSFFQDFNYIVIIKIEAYHLGNGIGQCRYQFNSEKYFTIELVTALPNAVTKMIVKHFYIYLGDLHPKMRSMKNTIRLLIY